MKAKAILTALFLTALFFPGCSYPADRCLLTRTVAELPNGDTIHVETEVWSQGTGLAKIFTHRPDGPVTGPAVVWQRANQPDKPLVTLLTSPGSAKHIPAPPFIPAGIPDPDHPKRIILVPNGEIPTEQVRADANNDRVIVVRDEQVYASFDYTAGVAILSSYYQPDWATLDFGRVIKETQRPMFLTPY